jgi:predicted protein tyrosine phosphatase
MATDQDERQAHERARRLSRSNHPTAHVVRMFNGHVFTTQMPADAYTGWATVVATYAYGKRAN